MKTGKNSLLYFNRLIYISGLSDFLHFFFLEKNRLLFSETGEKRIADNALVALTLMIAVSKPDEKDTMVKVIVNLINKNN